MPHAHPRIRLLPPDLRTRSSLGPNPFLPLQVGGFQLIVQVGLTSEATLSRCLGAILPQVRAGRALCAFSGQNDSAHRVVLRCSRATVCDGDFRLSSAIQAVPFLSLLRCLLAALSYFHPSSPLLN